MSLPSLVTHSQIYFSGCCVDAWLQAWSRQGPGELVAGGGSALCQPRSLSSAVLSGVFTDVEASLKEIRDLLEEDEAQERKLQELLGKVPPPQGSPLPPSPGLAEVSKECSKYMEVHEKASFTNTELHKAMNLHIGNLRLLSGPLEQVRAALPSPALTEGEWCCTPCLQPSWLPNGTPGWSWGGK